MPQRTSKAATPVAVRTTPAAAPASAPAKPAISDTPIRHISPEEAVAHIQALLDAKQDRARQEPTYPGAGSAGLPAKTETAPLPSAAEGAGGNIQTNPPRDDLGKRGD
jgi:hypothetical protein